MLCLKSIYTYIYSPVFLFPNFLCLDCVLVKEREREKSNMILCIWNYIASHFFSAEFLSKYFHFLIVLGPAQVCFFLHHTGHLAPPCAQHSARWTKCPSSLPSVHISFKFSHNLMFPTSCQFLPAPFLLLVDTLFTFYFTSLCVLVMSTVKYIFFYFFLFQQVDIARNVLSPCMWKVGKESKSPYPKMIINTLLLSSEKWQVAKRIGESPPTAGFSGSFPQEAGMHERQAIWKASLVTEPEFFRGLEVPMSSCNLSQNPITHH